MDMSLSKLWEIVKDRKAWHAVVHGVTESDTTKRLSTHVVTFESESISRSVLSNSATLWAVGCQAPLSMEFSRQEYWSGLPFSFPGDLPYLGTELRVPTLHLGLPHCRQILYHCATWEAPF